MLDGVRVVMHAAEIKVHLEGMLDSMRTNKNFMEGMIEETEGVEKGWLRESRLKLMADIELFEFLLDRLSSESLPMALGIDDLYRLKFVER